LTYVPNQTQHTSLLTRPRPHSYRKAISPWNQVRRPANTVQVQNGSSNFMTHESTNKSRKRLVVALVKKHGTAPHYTSHNLTHISSSTSRARPKMPPWKHRQAPIASRIKNDELLKSESTSGTMKSISTKNQTRTGCKPTNSQVDAHFL
jgi:hypothetical protein